jgi:hypothetical protein
VKKPKAPELHTLKERLASLDERDIDQLYGLEPIYEPGRGLAALLPEEFVAVQCPYCGERLDVRVDVTEGERSYIEDCQVCCRPIEFAVELEDSGAFHAVRVQRLD